MGKNKKTSAHAPKAAEHSIRLDDHNAMRVVLGVHDSHIKEIERFFNVSVHVRGTDIKISGSKESIDAAGNLIWQLYRLARKGYPLSTVDIEQALNVIGEDKYADLEKLFSDVIIVPSKRRSISPRTPGQRGYVNTIKKHDIVFGIGPAGTGKTYLAMAMAVASLINRECDRIILTRPAVEAGEKLGFLPGSMQEKVNPYLRPLYDALHDMMEIDETRHLIDQGMIEVAPLAFMRGRTLNGSFVILDEAQNCTSEQMKMFLTRLGFDSKAVITGDVTQIDLPAGKNSGLLDAKRILSDVDGIAFYYLSDGDIVRHRLVQSIVKAYEREEKTRGQTSS